MARKWLNVHKGFLDEKKPCFRVKDEEGNETVYDYLYVYGPAWFEVSDIGQAWLVTDGKIETDESKVKKADESERKPTAKSKKK